MSATPEEAKPAPPEAPPTEPNKQQKEEEVGDFITRHVLEKDSVFFDG